MAAVILFVSCMVVCSSDDFDAATVGTMTEGGITYTLYDDYTANLTNAPKTTVTGNVTIPSSLTYNGKEYKVTSVGGGSSITTRGFYNNVSVVSVVLPDTVTKVGAYSFNGCSALVSVDLGKSVSSIDAYAFQKCTSLKSIDIPSTVTSFGNYSFNGCSALGSVNVPYGVMAIPDYIFQGCVSLTSFEIPNTVTSLGKYSFSGCTGLVSVDIPSSVLSIGTNCFKGCDSLQTAVIVNGTLSVGPHVKEYTVPGTVTAIAASAFSGNTDIESITVPSSVKSIGNSAFNGCSSLKNLYLESADTIELGTNVFNGCISLTSDIIVKGLLYFIPAVESYTIPSTVVNIVDGAASGNTVLKSIVIPSSVENYGTNIFKDCTSLESVTLPDNITFINDGMFYGATSLKSIVIPERVTNINANAFRNSGLTTFTFTKNLVSLGSYAFSGTSLTEVEIPSVISSIGSYAFSACTSLTTVKMLSAPDVLFDQGVFYNDTALETLVLPEGMTSIPSTAFRGCTSLSEVVLPSTLKTIGQYAFTGTALVDVEIPEGVTSIGVSAFRTILTLKTVVLPSTLKTVGSYMFAESGTQNGLDLVIKSNITLSDSMFSKSGNVLSITFLNSGTITAKTFTGYTGSVPEYRVSNGVGFFGYANSKLTVTDNCVPVTTSDGRSGKMLVTASGTGLTIPKGCVAIAPELLSRNLSSITVLDSDYTYSGGMLTYRDTCLVYVKPGSKNVDVPEGITRLGSYSLSACGSIGILDLPSTLTYVAPDAVPSGVTVSKVIFGSDATISVGSFNGNPSVPLFFGPGIYKGGSLAGYTYGGVAIHTDSGILFATLNDDMAELDFTINGDSVTVEVILPEYYSESVLEATFNGEPVAVKDRKVTLTVNGECELAITGVVINKRDITVDSGNSKVTCSTGTDDVPQGSEVRFSVIPSTGYTFGKNFKVTVNGTVLVPVTVSDYRQVFSFTLVENATISVTGIVPISVHKVMFEGTSEVEVVDGNLVTLPAEPVRPGYTFVGWFNGGELFDPSVPVTSDLTLKAKWVSASNAYEIGYYTENGTIVATDGTYSEIIPGERVVSGGYVVFEYIPSINYEIKGWNVNGVFQPSDSNRLVLNVESDIYVEPVIRYSVISGYVYYTDTVTPYGEEGYTLWAVKSEYSNYMYSPTIMDGSVYVKSGSYLLRIDLYTGEILAKVDTGVSSTFYDYPSAGNGIILDGTSGNAYSADLVKLFTIPVHDSKVLYYNGAFYLSDSSNIYRFDAKDEDPVRSTNVQQPVWTASSNRYISSYQGQSHMVFVENYLLCIENGSKDADERWISTYDLTLGKKIDSVCMTMMYGTLLNAGYLSYYDGYAYLSVYTSGLFNDASGNIMNLGRVAVDSTGHFDDVDMDYVDFGHTHYSSSLVGYGDYGYINSNDVLYVLDLDTLEVVASCPSTMIHGNISISIGYSDKVYIYLEPYSSSTDLRVFVHDLTDPGSLTDVSMTGVLPYQQYGSQQPHFGPEGQVIYHNDSGYLFCIVRVASLEGASTEGGSVAVYKNGTVYTGKVSIAQGTAVSVHDNVLAIGEYTFVAESDSLQFSGWSVADGWRVNGDTVFIASFSEEHESCTVTFVFDGYTISYEADKGDVVTVPPMVPYRASTEDYSFTFAGWNGYTEGMKVDGDMVFEALFTKTRLYTVTIVYSDSESVSVKIPAGNTVSGPREVYKYYLDSEYTVEWSEKRLVKKNLTLYGLDRLSGTDGNLEWVADFDSGVFTVTGNGAMTDYDSVSAIPWYPYRDGILTIVIGNGVTSVGSNSFKNCTSVNEIVISDSVKTIGKYAFYHNYALEHIVFGEGIDTVGGNAFTGVSLLYADGSTANKAFYAGTEFEGSLKVLVCDGFEKDLTETLVWGMDFTTGTFTVSGEGAVPDYKSPTVTPWYALRSSILSVVFSDGVTSIGQNVFYAYTNLKEVTVSDTVTYIGAHAFAKNPGLTKVDMGTSVTEFGTVVFSNRFIGYGGAMTASASNLAGKCFVSDGTDLVIESVRGTIGDVTWKLDFGSSTLTISGEGSTGNCSGVTVVPWYQYRSAIVDVVVEDGVTYLTDFAFYSYTSVKTVVLGNDVTGIGKNSLRGCKSLESITFGEDFSTIGSNAMLGITFLDQNGKTVKTASAMAGHTFVGSDGILVMQ